MSGSAQFFIQPSSVQLATTEDWAPGQWTRAIPAPGFPGHIPAVAGQPDCRNLAAASPPTLLEAYEIYAIDIGWWAFAQDNATLPTPNMSVEATLLINDRPAYSTIATHLGTPYVAGANGYQAFGAWTADLVNPVELGARDRLGLRVGMALDQPANSPQATIIVGSQAWLDVTGAVTTITPYESTISYRVIDLPGSRRL